MLVASVQSPICVKDITLFIIVSVGENIQTCDFPRLFLTIIAGGK